MERVDYESLIISDLLGFYNTKSLDINPWYQRRSVWSPPQKAYLMNTIFEKKPVPSIYIGTTVRASVLGSSILSTRLTTASRCCEISARISRRCAHPEPHRASQRRQSD